MSSLPQFLQAQSDVAVIPFWVIWLVVAIVGAVLLVGLLAVVFLCGWYAKKLLPRRHRAQPPKVHGDFSLLKEQPDGPGIPSSSPTFSSLATSVSTVPEQGINSTVSIRLRLGGMIPSRRMHVVNHCCGYKYGLSVWYPECTR